MRKDAVKGYALGLAATLLWASYYPAARYLFGSDEAQTDPLLLSLIRIGFAMLFFVPFILFSAKRRALIPKLIKNEWKTLLLLTLSGVLLEGVLVFVSLKFTTAARSSLMANASPIFTVLLARMFLKEKIAPAAWFGMVIGFAGVSLGMLSHGSDVFAAGSPRMLIGDLMALASGAAWAVYTISGVRIIGEYDSVPVTMLTFFFGLLLFPPVMLCFGSPFDFRLSAKLWIGMAYIGLFPCGLAYCSWLAALRFVSSSKLGAYGYLSALLTAGISIVLLQEKITGVFLLSIVLTLSGMYLMMRSRKKSASEDRR